MTVSRWTSKMIVKMIVCCFRSYRDVPCHRSRPRQLPRQLMYQFLLLHTICPRQHCVDDYTACPSLPVPRLHRPDLPSSARSWLFRHSMPSDVAAVVLPVRFCTWYARTRPCDGTSTRASVMSEGDRPNERRRLDSTTSAVQCNRSVSRRGRGKHRQRPVTVTRWRAATAAGQSPVRPHWLTMTVSVPVPTGQHAAPSGRRVLPTRQCRTPTKMILVTGTWWCLDRRLSVRERRCLCPHSSWWSMMRMSPANLTVIFLTRFCCSRDGTNLSNLIHENVSFLEEVKMLCKK